MKSTETENGIFFYHFCKFKYHFLSLSSCRPEKRSDGSYIYDRIPNAAELTRPPVNHPQMLYKKRAYEQESPSGPGASGSGSGQPAKIQRTDTSGRGHVPNVVPPKGRVATIARIQGRKCEYF